MEQLIRLVAESFGRWAIARCTADLGDELTATWQWPDAARPKPGTQRCVARSAAASASAES